MRPKTDPKAFGLFGLYRYVLATQVMMSHFLSGRWQVIGEYAVFGFFILSGYVVSYILHYSYMPQTNGIAKYIANRALRIYPLLWITSFFMLWIMSRFYPELDEHSVMGYPHNLHGELFAGWLGVNLLALNSILLLGYMLKPTLVPASWSLGTELFFWLLMPVLLKSRPVRIGVMIFAGIYTASMIILSFHPPRDILVLRYFSPMAATLPFCLGLGIFLWKRAGGRRIPHEAGIGAIILLPVVVIGSCYLFADPYFTGFYLTVALNFLVIQYLSYFDPRRIGALLEKTDRFLGDLAYPLFLLHVPALLLVGVWLPSFKSEHHALYISVAVLAANLLALTLHKSVEFPINRLRLALKNGNRKQA